MTAFILTGPYSSSRVTSLTLVVKISPISMSKVWLWLLILCKVKVKEWSLPISPNDAPPLRLLLINTSELKALFTLIKPAPCCRGECSISFPRSEA